MLKVEDWDGTPVIQIGDYPLAIETDEADAERCCDAINALLAAKVREGIERVRELAIGKSEGWADHPAERLCDIALAAFEAEQGEADQEQRERSEPL